jgi:hypothetical protein
MNVRLAEGIDGRSGIQGIEGAAMIKKLSQSHTAREKTSSHFLPFLPLSSVHFAAV